MNYTAFLFAMVKLCDYIIKILQTPIYQNIYLSTYIDFGFFKISNYKDSVFFSENLYAYVAKRFVLKKTRKFT